MIFGDIIGETTGFSFFSLFFFVLPPTLNKAGLISIFLKLDIIIILKLIKFYNKTN